MPSASPTEKQRCIANFNKYQLSSRPVNQRAILQTNKSRVSRSPGPGVLENWGGWGVLLIRLSFGDLLTLVKFNTVKNVSFSSEYSSVFFPPHCFITAGHFPTLSWRDQRGCIDIHPSLSFMKGKSFTSGKKRHCFFPIRFVPTPSPPRPPPPPLSADFLLLS